MSVAETLNTTHIPPSQTERRSPGFTTIVGMSIFAPFVFLSDVRDADDHFRTAHGHDRDMT